MGSSWQSSGLDLALSLLWSWVPTPGQGTKILQAVCHRKKKKKKEGIITLLETLLLNYFSSMILRKTIHGVGLWLKFLDSSVVSIDAFH